MKNCDKFDEWTECEKRGCKGCYFDGIIAEIDYKISVNLDELISKVIKQKYKDTELLTLQEIIKKQKKENEELKIKNNELTTITKTYNAIKQDMTCSNTKIIIADINYFDNGIFNEKFIHESKIKEEIRKIKYDIAKTKEKIKEENTFPNFMSRWRLLRLESFITKSNEIKERLEKILNERN